jgi:hypothetical protein
VDQTAAAVHDGPAAAMAKVLAGAGASRRCGHEGSPQVQQNGEDMGSVLTAASVGSEAARFDRPTMMHGGGTLSSM